MWKNLVRCCYFKRNTSFDFLSIPSQIHKPAKVQICEIYLCLQTYPHSNDVWFLKVLKHGMFDIFTPNNLFLIVGINTSYIYYVNILKQYSLNI